MGHVVKLMTIPVNEIIKLLVEEGFLKLFPISDFRFMVRFFTLEFGVVFGKYRIY